MSSPMWLAIGWLSGVLTVVLLRPWLRALSSAAPLPLGYIAGMSLRGSPPMLLVDAHVALAKRGHDVSIHTVEATYLSYRSAIRNEQDLADAVERQLREAGGA